MEQLIGRLVKVGFYAGNGEYHRISVAVLEDCYSNGNGELTMLKLRHGKVYTVLLTRPGMIIQEVVK